jgi:hypothetical protein
MELRASGQSARDASLPIAARFTSLDGIPANSFQRIRSSSLATTHEDAPVDFWFHFLALSHAFLFRIVSIAT